jgi:hypothetical protein
MVNRLIFYHYFGVKILGLYTHKRGPIVPILTHKRSGQPANVYYTFRAMPLGFNTYYFTPILTDFIHKKIG